MNGEWLEESNHMLVEISPRMMGSSFVRFFKEKISFIIFRSLQI